jgi:hypothetical protein
MPAHAPRSTASFAQVSIQDTNRTSICGCHFRTAAVLFEFYVLNWG